MTGPRNWPRSYEQAQAEVDAEARFLATEADRREAPVPYTLTPRADYLLDSPEASNDEPEAGS